MKKIPLSANEALIEAVRSRAASEKTTLNEQFSRWLADYAQARDRMQRYASVMEGLRGQMKVGCKLNRDAMNER